MVGLEPSTVLNTIILSNYSVLKMIIRVTLLESSEWFSCNNYCRFCVSASVFTCVSLCAEREKQGENGVRYKTCQGAPAH